MRAWRLVRGSSPTVREGAKSRRTSRQQMNRRQFNSGLLGTAGAIAFRPFASQSQLRVNGARIVGHLNALAEFGKNPQGGVSRLAYSDADRLGREYVFGL